ncbi:MAG: hypothetical protein NTY70_03000, partial [Burkholderiales bacterium]|nr:hypothetical protein [Burkholderiales bacterium]
TWSANKLSLNAGQNIVINADLNATATASLAFLYGQSSTNGVGATYTVATGAKIYIPTGAAFTWKKGTAGLSKNLVLDNGLLRFGDGIANSFTTDGQLKQPFYFDTVAPIRSILR